MLEQSLAACKLLQVGHLKPTVLLGWGMSAMQPILRQHYEVIDIATAYSREVQISNLNGILTGEIAGAIVKSGKFIDRAALAFLAREAGCIVTTHDGSTLPPLHACKDYSLPRLIVAASRAIHQHLLEAVQSNLSTQTNNVTLDICTICAFWLAAWTMLATVS